MRTGVVLWFIACLGLAGSACKNKEASAPQGAPAQGGEAAAVAQPPAADPAPAATPPQEGAAAMAKKMANCPSAVPGARTVVGDSGDTVEVSITATDPAAAAEIRKRAQHLIAVQAASAPAVQHTGSGTGGGELGKCPVLMASARLQSSEIEGGVKVVLTPEQGVAVALLRDEARRRVGQLPPQ